MPEVETEGDNSVRGRWISRLSAVETSAKATEPRRLLAVLASALVAATVAIAITISPLWLLTSDRSASRLADVAQAVATLFAIVGATATGIYAFRSQIIREREGKRGDEQVFSDRYTKAAELLASPSAAARLAGLHSLSSLSDDWPTGRKACISALCSYLRLPPPERGSAEHKAESEVRRTAWKIIRDHLATPDDEASWHNEAFDFSGGSFDNIDLDGIQLETTHFIFRNGTMEGGELRLRQARLGSSTFDFTGCNIVDMKILGSELSTFKGGIFFDDATIQNSHFIAPRIDVGRQSGIHFRNATIDDSTLEFDDDGVAYTLGGKGMIAGEISFHDATLSNSKVLMHLYVLTGHLVFDNAETSTVEISLPTDIRSPAYVNLDLSPRGETAVRLTGAFSGDTLRIRPDFQASKNCLSVTFTHFSHEGGELLVSAAPPTWSDFCLSALPKKPGVLTLFEKFPAHANLTVDWWYPTAEVGTSGSAPWRDQPRQEIAAD